MPKFICNNVGCKHRVRRKCTQTTVTIEDNGKCESFEKGFAYYVRLVWRALENKNFIDALELTPDLRIGLVYVMKLYNLGFAEAEWGTCRMIMLKDGETGPALNYEDIIKREINTEELNRLFEDFQNGIMPGQNTQQAEPEHGEKFDLDFGWLSPNGVFTESPFGHHEESAEEISNKNGWDDDYFKWRAEYRGSVLAPYRDFLIHVKGYCLIHNPTGAGGYVVTHTIALTKKQKDFLYAYFIDKGDRFKAEQFMKE